MLAKSVILASALAALSPAQAAVLPLLNSLTHGTTTAHSDLAVFANAWLAASTGGAYDKCDALSGQLGLNLNLGLTLGATFVNQFNSWAVGQCWNSYHDKSLCGEISAYLAATFYAYQRGWTAVEFLAALGVDRVTHWQETIGSLCGTPGCPAGTCDILHGQWNGWYTTYITLDASAYVSEALELKKLGLFALIDTSINANAVVKTNTNIHRGLDLPLVAAGGEGSGAIVGNVVGPLTHLDVAGAGHAVGGAFIHRGLPNVFADAAAHIDGKTNVKVDAPFVHADAAAAGHIDVKGSAIIHRDLPVIAAQGSTDAHLVAGVNSALLKAGTAAFAHTQGNAVIGRDVFAAGQAAGAAAVDKLVHAAGAGEGFIYANKNGVVGAGSGSGGIIAGPAKIVGAGAGSAAVY